MTDDDESTDLSEAWERHPFTRQSGLMYAEKADKALKELLGLCAESSDPKVTGALARYRALAEATAYFKPKKARND